MKIVSTTQMRQLEQAAVDAGATWAGLMEQAGQGVARAAIELLGGASGRSVLVLVGPGNNGGDGLVAARLLHAAGAHVQLYLWQRRQPEQDQNWQACRSCLISEHQAAEDPGRTNLRSLLAQADLLLDALLGMGSRPAEADLATIIACLNQRQPAGPPMLAVDLPTGVNSDNGSIGGVAVRADLTVATGLPKRGLLLYPGRAWAGTLALAPIDLPPTYLESMMSDLLTADYARQLLPDRPAAAHKGSFGRALILAGSLRYPGAAWLACAGAARVGAGLVTLGAGRSVLGMGGRMPEATLLPLPEGDWGAPGPDSIDELGKVIDDYAAMVFGPGLGTGDATAELLRRLFGLDQARTRVHVGFIAGSAVTPSPATTLNLPPTVLDADGLNLLAAIDDWAERLPKGRLVLTPHPGEMRRLLRVEELPADVVTVAADAAQAWGQVVVLKGATTVVAAPDGRTLLHDGANPALATAGTGDVLAGAIGGLLAQGLAPYDAAALGVYLHAAAGARVRSELGEAGALASDLLPELPRAIKTLRAEV